MEVIAWIMAVLGCGTDLWLARRPPLLLTGVALRVYAVTAFALHLTATLCSFSDGTPLFQQALWLFMFGTLFLMSATDLREKMVYDIHSGALLAGGAVCALTAQGGIAFGRYIFCVAVSGVLFFVMRGKLQLGAGDSRAIAALTLYFPLSAWMEIMILALGTAGLYGILKIILRKGTVKTEMAFMPFLLGSALVERIIDAVG